MELRELDPAEHEVVAGLWRRTGRDVVEERELAALLAHGPGLGVVARDGERLVGVALGTWDGRRAWILRLGVDPAARRAGVGTALVAELEQRLRRRGARRINIHVLPEEPGALAFWRHLGYLPQPDVLCSKPLPPA